MNKKDIESIISKIEKEDSIFAKKAILDPLSFPSKIIGREKQLEQLVRYLIGYKQGYVVPFVSVYGRSGSGKSVVVRFACENIKEISYVFVNLRQAKTVFGAANLILSELGEPNLKSAQGINGIIDTISSTIESVLKKEEKQLCVLALDEFDMLFYDTRGRPSDFIYKLIVLGENLKKKGFLLCIIGISNNILSEYDLDDRVRSRIGSYEIFFEPYSKSDVLSILKDRAGEAFAKKIDDNILEYCADLASEEHGDARRSIDLLRVAAEIASSKREVISKIHVDLAREELAKDRIKSVISSLSYHLRVACAALVRMTFMSDEDWHTTSDIYDKYCEMLSSGTKPLGYRRMSELLTDLTNSGLVTSQAVSHGRKGYGRQYKLTISPEMAGPALSEQWWKDAVKNKINKKENDALYDNIQNLGKGRFQSMFPKSLESLDAKLAKLKKKYNIS
jgi:cell division control protein 6